MEEKEKTENAEEVENKVTPEAAEEPKMVNSEEVVSKLEYDDLEDRLKRVLAEFDNYKKRSSKERESIYGMITADVVATMLPIMDNLEKALEVKTEDTKYQDGIALVARQFKEALKGLGLEEIEAVGKRFDPEFHEAVSHIEDETKGEQEIVQEYRKGYKIGNKVVRHSMVIVAN